MPPLTSLARPSTSIISESPSKRPIRSSLSHPPNKHDSEVSNPSVIVLWGSEKTVSENPKQAPVETQRFTVLSMTESGSENDGPEPHRTPTRGNLSPSRTCGQKNRSLRGQNASHCGKLPRRESIKTLALPRLRQSAYQAQVSEFARALVLPRTQRVAEERNTHAGHHLHRVFRAQNALGGRLINRNGGLRQPADPSDPRKP